MAKDPAFLFYPNDYIGGTMGMTFEEKGAYIELLMMQFNRGHMTSHMIGQTVGHIWDTIKVKFIQDENGLWYNKRLDDEKLSRQKYSESRRNNLSGANQYTKKKGKKTGHKSGHMTSHMENEDENENVHAITNRVPVLEDVKKFFSENGYTEESAEKAFRYYEDGNWHDSKGNKVKNWKQKMRVVWFKDENKEKQKRPLLESEKNTDLAKW